MADITPSALANSIMGKLYDVLTNGDETVPKSADNFFSWCTPGIPVDPDDFRFLSQGLTGVVRAEDAAALTAAESTPVAAAASSGTATATAPAPPRALTPDQLNQLRAQDVNAVYQQAEMLARIVDFVPDLVTVNNDRFAQFSVENSEGTLSDRYRHVLQLSQVAEQQLDQATQDKIAKFRGLLQATSQKKSLTTDEVTTVTGPSPLVQAYNEKMAAYNAAALQYNAARIAALAANDPAATQNWAINSGILRNQVVAAMDDWVTNGYKGDYEDIAAYIEQVTQRDMSLLKQGYAQQLQNARLTGISSGSDFYYTALAPANFAESSGWSTFSFSIGDVTQYQNSSFSSTGWKAQAGASYLGIFGGQGNADKSKSVTEYSSGIDSENFRLTFSICQIPIIRPWFEDAFLMSKCWRFDQSNQDYGGRRLSDGGSPPTGYLCAYPTAIVFVRDLELGISQSSTLATFIQEQQSASQGGGGAVSLGPFIIGGSGSHYSKSGYSKRNVDTKWNDQGLSVPGMQIAGFKCHVLGAKAPDPDPGITNWV